MIRVVLVDDSPFVCQLLAEYILSAPDLEVVGQAHSGRAALEVIKQMRPTVVILDVEMPEMGGLETLGRIMRECPTPVILMTGVSKRSANATLEGINLGAVDFILKYTPGVDTDPNVLACEITSKLRIAANVKVVRPTQPKRTRKATPFDGRPAATKLGSNENKRREFPARVPRPPARASTRRPSPVVGGVVVIGASTGGPKALRDLLTTLPADFPLGILVVQHMPAFFTTVLADNLDRQTALSVREAREGDAIGPGIVFVAPGDHHMRVDPSRRVRLDKQPPIAGHRPSIDVTMKSVAQVYGARAHAVVLTGMGSDGAIGLEAIRQRGGRTYVQDSASCVVNGMPQRAIDKGVVHHIGVPSVIADLLRLDCEETLLSTSR
jgi:two-component system chemotaxis response regulator CheB